MINLGGRHHGRDGYEWRVPTEMRRSFRGYPSNGHTRFDCVPPNLGVAWGRRVVGHAFDSREKNVDSSMFPHCDCRRCRQFHEKNGCSKECLLLEKSRLTDPKAQERYGDVLGNSWVADTHGDIAIPKWIAHPYHHYKPTTIHPVERTKRNGLATMGALVHY
jgi:hypothetical protein